MWNEMSGGGLNSIDNRSLSCGLDGWTNVIKLLADYFQSYDLYCKAMGVFWVSSVILHLYSLQCFQANISWTLIRPTTALCQAMRPRVRPSSLSEMTKTRGHGYKLKIPACNSDIHNYFFSTRVFKIWNSLPKYKADLRRFNSSLNNIALSKYFPM